ncbi:MAG TPA: hypothetical protein VGI12_07900 [Vicinamibacterales bacterium]
MTMAVIAVTVAVQIGAPTKAATLEVKGEPIRLAWSEDGSQLAVQTAERDKAGMMTVNPRFYLVAVGNGSVTSAPAWPEWADKYWAWKSNNAAPWSAATTIDLKQDQKTMSATSAPMGGSLAKGGTASPTAGTAAEDVASHAYGSQTVNTVTLTLLGETVGYFEGMQFIPGYTFGWSPKDLASIAYVNGGGHLAVMDKDKGRQQVDGTKNVLLPAWSADGAKIAFLEKAGKKYELYLAPVTR